MRVSSFPAHPLTVYAFPHISAAERLHLDSSWPSGYPLRKRKLQRTRAGNRLAPGETEMGTVARPLILVLGFLVASGIALGQGVLPMPLSPAQQPPPTPNDKDEEKKDKKDDKKNGDEKKDDEDE